jgi:hypothetical protein
MRSSNLVTACIAGALFWALSKLVDPTPPNHQAIAEDEGDLWTGCQPNLGLPRP